MRVGGGEREDHTRNIVQPTASLHEARRHILDDGLHVLALTRKVDDGAVVLGSRVLDALDRAFGEFFLKGEDFVEVEFCAGGGREEQRGTER